MKTFKINTVNKPANPIKKSFFPVDDVKNIGQNFEEYLMKIM